MPLTLTLLGSIQATLDDHPITGFESDKIRALLAYLVIESNRPHRRDALAALFWPEQDDRTAAHNLRQALLNLRQVLGDHNRSVPFLLVNRADIRMNLDGVAFVDVAEVLALIDTCQRHPHRSRDTCRSCLSRLERVAALYHGPFLGGLSLADSEPFEEWASARRQQLHRAVLEALHTLTTYHDRRGAFDQACWYAQRQLGLEPWREQAHRQLMRALAHSGQRAAALRQFQVCQRILMDELGVEPSADTWNLYHQIRADSLRRIDSDPAPPNNLPLALTSFVGREEERGQLRDLLATGHLITLTGMGGCGKTRLAIEVSREMIHAFPDGVWLVDLSPLSEPTLVLQAIATVLKVHGAPNRPYVDRVSDHLGDKRVLLILDNCEHLVGACAALAHRLLASCPNLAILVTSREPLGVEGEVTWRVPPLAVPGQTVALSAGEEGMSAAKGFDAIQLFIERAEVVRPSFELTPKNVEHVAQICRQLDGIPLAIELAAAWVRILPEDELLDRLADRFRLLRGTTRTGPPHHQTLRATLDWSYAHLTDPERGFFRRLAIFAGGWTLDAAAAVCKDRDAATSQGAAAASDLEALDLLGQLVDKSLVLVDSRPGRPRYRMLDTVRQYALELLLQSDEAETIRTRQREWFLALLRKNSQSLLDATQETWIENVEAEHDNLRVALQTSLKDDPDTAVSLASELWRFWRQRGYHAEGRRWLDQVLTRAKEVDLLARPDPRTPIWLARAQALVGAGVLAAEQGDARTAQAMLDEGRNLSRRAGEHPGLVECLRDLEDYMLRWFGGSPEQIKKTHEERVISARASGNARAEGWAIVSLADQAASERDYAKARSLVDEGLAIFQRIGDSWSVGNTLMRLGWLALLTGDGARGRDSLRESVDLARHLGNKQGVGIVLISIARLVELDESRERSRELFQESLTLLRDVGSPIVYDALFLIGNSALEAGQLARGIRLCAVGAAGRQPFGPSWRAMFYDWIMPACEANLAAARVEVGQATFAALWAEGEPMTLAQAIELALGED